MSLSSYKITDGDISSKGVVAAPDKLSGTAAQNKAIFDRLIRESVKGLYNGLIDLLSSSAAADSGAGSIGAADIDGLVFDNTVQGGLQSLKTLVDACETQAAASSALALKEDKTVTANHFKAVSFNDATGVFTFTRESGSTVSIDTLLEKVAVNFAYDSSSQSLILTLKDGSTQTVSLSDFITELEFLDSGQIDFSVSNHKVTATVKSGSITDTMLSSALISALQDMVSAADAAANAAVSAMSAAVNAKNSASGYAIDAQSAATAAVSAKNTAVDAKDAASASAALAAAWAANGAGTPGASNNAKYFAGQAAASAASAAFDASDAEAYGAGTRAGADVGSSDPAYHNNAKYYSDAAGASASSAASDASDAEAYGAGTRAGADVGSSDPAYHNNAKYYSDSAGAAAASAAETACLTDRDDENKSYTMAWSVKNGFPVLTLTERT